MELINFGSTCRISWNDLSAIAFQHRLIIGGGLNMSEGDIFSFALGVATGAATGAALLWMAIARFRLRL